MREQKNITKGKIKYIIKNLRFDLMKRVAGSD